MWSSVAKYQSQVGKSLFFSVCLIMSLLMAMPTQVVGAAPQQKIKVITHNLAGGTMSAGKVKGIAALKKQIRSYNPDVIFVQEICVSQYQALRTEYPLWHMHFTSQQTRNTNCDQGLSSAIGQLILSRHPLSNVAQHQIGSAYEGRVLKSYYMTCAEVRLPYSRHNIVQSFLGCGTHIQAIFGDATSRVKFDQVNKIHNTLDPVIRSGKFVVVAGDFNAGPVEKELSYMYRLTNTGTFNGEGNFHEADQTDKKNFKQRDDSIPARSCKGKSACRIGEYTYRKRGTKKYISKLDYVFFSVNKTNGRSGLSASCVPSSTSDHCIYKASAVLTN